MVNFCKHDSKVNIIRHQNVLNFSLNLNYTVNANNVLRYNFSKPLENDES